ncbi:hypothetical protein COY27_00975 [Candidatus Woesearchaeota archaeon CG_4_10_14_0_2_um_filter_33_13]|nr:MAG: hypothetical protein COY27_00975 [Candidatus Woesearchaeota archaeon CG_4_10_14_0_2_um_filter_33_13]
MLSLWLLTKKNIKLLLRAKASALIILFAPLIIILLLGVSYNSSSLYGLNIGVYSSSFTDEVNSFVNLLQEKEFTINNYDNSETCINDVKKGEIHTCINLPDSFQVNDNTAKEVTFYVDPSRVNIVWMVQEVVQEKFNIKAQELSEGIAQDLLGRLSSAKTDVTSNKNGLNIVKDKANIASSTAVSTKSSLSGLDLSASSTNYSSDIVSNVTSELETAKTKVTAAITALDNSNVSSSEKSSIKSKLNAAESSLSGLTNSVNGTSGIAGLINSLTTELNAAKTKLNSASNTVSNANSNLDSVAAALTESIKSLETIQTNLGAIVSNLEGQKVTDASTISTPLITKIEMVSEENTYLGYLFPAILVIVVMFSSLLLGTTLVMMEKTSPAFLRNFFLPIRKSTFIISTYLTNLFLILIQILIILGISLLFLRDSLPSIPYVALILFVSASMFTFLGMVVGYLFNSEETGVLAAFSIGCLFLFISGVILPLEGLSAIVRELSAFNPFVITENLLRNVFIFGNSLNEIWFDLIMLISYTIVLFIIILIIETLLHKHLVNRFMRHHHRAHRHKDKINKNEA